jgi:hypothetical protein
MDDNELDKLIFKNYQKYALIMKQQKIQKKTKRNHMYTSREIYVTLYTVMLQYNGSVKNIH